MHIFLFGLVALSLVMRFSSSASADLSYFLLAGYAVFGRVQAIQALALSWFFSMVSPGIAPDATFAAVGRYLVISFAALSLFLRCTLTRERLYITRPVFFTFALGAFLIVHSILFSPIPDVSILKAVSWTVVMATLLSAWAGLALNERGQLERQLFGGLALLVLISIPLVFTSIGYLRNDTGFQGVLNHPQVFGPTVAILGCWLAGRLLESSKPNFREILLFFLCLVFIVISESRTAGLALAVGVFVAVLFLPFTVGMSVRRIMPGLFSLRLRVLVFTVAILVVFGGPALSSSLSDYFLKRGDTSGLLETAELSRGLLVYTMMTNIENNPMAGIGFGLASDPTSMLIDRDPVFGLPIGASIEKGVLPIAVLEELGFIGFFLVVVWLWLIVQRCGRAGVKLFAVLATLLLINLGESTLFSPSGMGLLPLILLSWTATSKPLVKIDRVRV